MKRPLIQTFVFGALLASVAIAAGFLKCTTCLVIAAYFIGALHSETIRHYDKVSP